MTMELETLARRVGERLRAAGLTLATAESCTGGWVAQALTAIPGSSAWFERGFVTYSNRSKQELLDVPAATLAAYGAVSEATVRAMAEGALAHSHADLALAVSGVAGPGGGSPDKPVGTVWLAWGRRDRPVRARHAVFEGERADVRRQAVAAALEGVLTLLEDGTG